MAANDEFGGHEVLHTASIIMDLWGGYVAEHGYLEDKPELKKEADAIFDRIFDFYQEMGRLTLMKEGDK